MCRKVLCGLPSPDCKCLRQEVCTLLEWKLLEASLEFSPQYLAHGEHHTHSCGGMWSMPLGLQ